MGQGASPEDEGRQRDLIGVRFPRRRPVVRPPRPPLFPWAHHLGVLEPTDVTKLGPFPAHHLVRAYHSPAVPHACCGLDKTRAYTGEVKRSLISICRLPPVHAQQRWWSPVWAWWSPQLLAANAVTASVLCAWQRSATTSAGHISRRSWMRFACRGAL